MPFPTRIAAAAITTLMSVGAVSASGQPINPALSGMVPSDLIAEPTVDAQLSAPVEASTAGDIPVSPSQDDAADRADPAAPRNLAELIAAQPQPAEVDSELHCLATAIFYEARSEPYYGQLAVGRVIVNRARSGRFPASLCGVVKQPGQFSFVRGGQLPAINSGSAQFRTALAVAQVALDDSWESPAEGALFFHARRVSPGWRLQRIGTVGNHVFYR